MKRFLNGLLLLGALGASAASAETLAIVGARVHSNTDAGTLDGVTVRIENGRIAAIGEDVSTAGATVIDGAGMELTPGLVAGFSTIGLVEVSAVDESSDFTVEDVELGAAYSVARAVNPESVLYGVARADGVTHALVGPIPANSLFGGLASLIRLDGVDDPVVAADVALVVVLGERAGDLSGGSRAAALQHLELGFEEARLYADDDDTDGLTLPRADLVALGRVLDAGGRVAVFADRASDIRHAVALLTDLGLQPVILGGAEAWRVADGLAAADVPVLIDPLANRPESYDSLGARLDNAALLHAAGVRVGFMERSGHNVRELRQYAGNAVAHGLPWSAGLAAITSVPADVWGAEGRGRIEVGASADLVLWTGDPFELTEWAEVVIVDGAVVPDGSRQHRLQERYRDPRSVYAPLD